MIIVLEGVDNSGKSTLARLLANTLSLPIQASEGPPKHEGEMDDRLDRYALLDNVIFDRHPIVSQSIYGTMRKGSEFHPMWTLRFYARRPLLVYCDPGTRRLAAHIRNPIDTDEHIEQIANNYRLLLKIYREWAITYSHFMYRIGDDIERITTAVTQVYRSSK